MVVVVVVVNTNKPIRLSLSPHSHSRSLPLLLPVPFPALTPTPTAFPVSRRVHVKASPPSCRRSGSTSGRSPSWWCSATSWALSEWPCALDLRSSADAGAGRSDGFLKSELETMLADYLQENESQLSSDPTFAPYYDTVSARSPPKPSTTAAPKTEEAPQKRSRRRTSRYPGSSFDHGSTCVFLNYFILFNFFHFHFRSYFSFFSFFFLPFSSFSPLPP